MKKKAARHLKWITRVAVLAAMLATMVMTTLVVSRPALAATIAVTSNTNWSALTVTSADTVEVRNGATLTVDVTNAVCGALQLGGTGSNTGSGTLTFSGTSPLLTVTNAGGLSGNVNLGGAGNTRNGTITFTSGSTLTTTGTVTMGSASNPAATITMTAGGTLSTAGFILSGTGTKTFTQGTGTVKLTSTNTLPNNAAFAAFNNLEIVSGTTTMGMTINPIGGTLVVDSGATFTIGAYSITVTGTTTVSGTITVTSTTGTKTFGSVIISGGTWTSNAAETYGISSMTLSGSTLGGSATGNFSVGAGGLTVSADTTNTFNAVTITVTGTTNVNGTISFASTTGTKTFAGLVIINSGGIWNNSGNSAINFRGGVTNNSGTFTAGTGSYTFTTNAQALTGTFSIPSVTVTGVTLTNTNTLTVGTALSGTGGTLAQGTGSLLNINGTSTIATLTATNSGNTVNYSGAAQTVKATTYNNLTLSGSGSKTTSTSVIVNGILSMEGTATASAAPTYGSSATLQYNTSTSRNTGAEWIATFSATGGVIIKNTGMIILNADKVLGADVPLTIYSGATLNTSINNRAVTFGGNFVNNGGTFIARGSAITIANTSATQSIDGFTTTGTVTMNKTAGTATFTGNVSGGALTINGSYPGTLHLGEGLTHTFAGNWTITNTGILDGGMSKLRIGGSRSSTTYGYFYKGASTVEYYASGNQVVLNDYYWNLTLSGSGTKTIGSSPYAPWVSGILSMEGTASISAAPVYDSGATLQYNTATNRTSGVEWITPFAATGGVIIANTGMINLSAAKVINTSLAINSGAKLNLSIWPSTAGSLTLGGANKVCGTWGSPNSTADNKDGTYFAPATGILNVLTCVKATPTITGITNQAITYGTASVTLSGIVSAGTIYPADGENVSVTINGESHDAIIGGGAGGFSISFPTATIPCSAIPYTITYHYAGNANLNAATDESTALTVNKADTTTGLASSVNPSTYGQSVTFTATINIPTATGAVQFYIDSETFGSPVTLSGGIATSDTTSSLSVGNHPVTAVYSGDSNYSTSTGTLTGGQTVTTISPTITIEVPSTISFGNLNIGSNTSSSGTLTVNVSPSASWHVTAYNTSTLGHMTTGTTNLSKAMRVQVQGQDEIVLSDNATSVATGTVNFSSNITFTQEVTWDDEPGTYQIVVTFTAMLD